MDANIAIQGSGWLPGGGETGDLIRSRDWALTPLGPLQDWPQNLRICIRIALNSPQPMFIWWGDELTHIYNDACARMMLGINHPWALGRPAREVWHENWGSLGARAEQVFRTGEPTWDQEFLLFLVRHGELEETYHTCSMSPVPGDNGSVAGLLCCATEDTQRVLDRRRERSLHTLSQRTAQTNTVADACRVAADTLAHLPNDLPFVLLYLTDAANQRANLAASAHLAAGSAGSPVTMNLEDRGAAWPLRTTSESPGGVDVNSLPQKFGEIPSQWPEPVQRAIVLPMRAAGQTAVIGFVIAGLSPRLPLDDHYRAFLEWMADHVAAGVANASAREAQRERTDALTEIADALAESEARRRASEEHFRLALAAGRMGTWEWDSEAAMLAADAVYQSLFGLPTQHESQPNEVYWAQMIPAEITAGVDSAKAALRTQTEFQMEQRIIRPNGDVHWMLSRGRPKHGHPTRMIGISFDITERKRMEEALRRSQGRLRAAVDLLGLGLYDWDPQTNALKWDARVKAMWGLPADAHVDYDVWRTHVHPDDLHRVVAAIERCSDPRGDGVYDIEYRVVGADGVERWIATRGQTSFQDGHAIAFSGVVLDITARKRAEERLRENEALLSAILAQLPVGVGLVDREGRFRVRGGILGNLWDAMMPSRDPGQAGRWRSFDADGRALDPSTYPGARALRGETVAPGMDFIHTEEDGRETWIRVAAAPFRGSAGEIEGAVAIMENVDLEKRAEQAMRESEERFRQFAEYTSDVIWMIRKEDRQLDYLSPAYENIWGQRRDLSLGHWTETIHPDDREHAVATLERALLGEVVVREYRREYRIVRPDGAMRSIRDTLFPMRDRQGRVQRVGGITQDVTVHTGSLVYVIDADEATRAQLELLLQRAGYNVKCFASGSDFLAVAPVLASGCVVLDFRSPESGGLAVAKQLKAIGSPLPVLVMGTSHGGVAVAVQAMKAGAADWIEVPYQPDVLLAAVASALVDIRQANEQSGEAERARARIAHMSPRERQVLEGLLAGGTNKTIGRELGISPRTVELHRAGLMEKLGAQTLIEAVRLAAAAGIPWTGPENKGRPTR